MTDPQTTDVPDDVAATWKRLAEARDMEKQWKDLADDLAGQLRATLAPGRYAIAGAPAFSITAVPKFNADHAWTVLTPEEAARCTELALSGDLIKQRLGVERYNACRVASGKPTVRKVESE